MGQENSRCGEFEKQSAMVKDNGPPPLSMSSTKQQEPTPSNKNWKHVTATRKASQRLCAVSKSYYWRQETTITWLDDALFVPCGGGEAATIFKKHCINIPVRSMVWNKMGDTHQTTELRVVSIRVGGIARVNTSRWYQDKSRQGSDELLVVSRQVGCDESVVSIQVGGMETSWDEAVTSCQYELVVRSRVESGGSTSQLIRYESVVLIRAGGVETNRWCWDESVVWRQVGGIETSHCCCKHVFYHPIPCPVILVTSHLCSRCASPFITTQSKIEIWSYKDFCYISFLYCSCLHLKYATHCLKCGFVVALYKVRILLLLLLLIIIHWCSLQVQRMADQQAYILVWLIVINIAVHCSRNKPTILLGSAECRQVIEENKQ